MLIDNVLEQFRMKIDYKIICLIVGVFYNLFSISYKKLQCPYDILLLIIGGCDIYLRTGDLNIDFLSFNLFHNL